MARPSHANKKKAADVSAGAVPAEDLGQAFPAIDLPITPPYPPAEARAVDEIPHEHGWLYEPKWDGFRCLAFRSGDEIVLQSKAGQPLGRYFPEMVEALRNLPAQKFVLDGEIIIRSGNGLDFDALLQRIHPAASRIKKLSQETPATYLVFDLLVTEKGRSIADQPLSARRMELQHFAAPNFQGNPQVHLSPAASDFETAERWMRQGAAHGLDGIVAKRLDCEYTSGERTGMVKIKRMRTADCVVGGFRWAQKGGEVGSLLLGVYNHEGQLDHIGFSSSFSKEDRKKLKPIITPLIAKESGVDAGFNGKAPGGPSRWAREDRNTEWFPLKHKLVGEFQYDHFSGGRFRHGTKFLRWRPDKKPEQCSIDQVKPGRSRDGWKVFGL
ncbi:MAG TPA: ATP-dependent DNA ligase [Candidatus Limnocylindrales bacterium]|jgi:ATP-dependent DNA ligase|nr:ATP-dependent DNA ligase [Candidatus Limnocylindrales bacterium]